MFVEQSVLHCRSAGKFQVRFHPGGSNHFDPAKRWESWFEAMDNSRENRIQSGITWT